MIYRITKFDASHNTNVMLSADGSGWTLHADKAASFPTVEQAVNVLCTHVHHTSPNAAVST